MRHKDVLLNTMPFLALLISTDIYRWIEGHPLTVEKLVHSLLLALAVGWLMTFSRDAQGIGFLSWIAATVLILTVLSRVERPIHLAPLTDAVVTNAAVFLPLLVGLGAAWLWSRRGSVKITVR